jgi:hypothetical protein
MMRASKSVEITRLKRKDYGLECNVETGETKAVRQGQRVAGSASAFAFQVGPLAGLDEISPVERMELRVALEHVELDQS